MKAFFIKVWEWIKTLFLGVKVIKREQWDKIMELANKKGIDLFTAIDENNDNIITLRELLKKIKNK